MDLTPYDKGSYLLLPAAEHDNMRLRRDLANAAARMGIPLLHEPTPSPANAYARRQIEAATAEHQGQRQIARGDQRALLANLEAVAAGKVTVL
jgi:hypothetical protein